MTNATWTPPILTLGELLERLGGISPDRVRFDPLPGTATEDDVNSIKLRENRNYELIDGVLVEKAMGYKESVIAIAIAAALRAFVVPRKLGFVSGPDGMVRLFPGLTRAPDVAFVSRGRLPDGRMPSQPIPDLAPDLAVEVISPGNTPAEMARKRRDYFSAGVRLIWMIDLDRRIATVYESEGEPMVVSGDDLLEGRNVLPGFSLSLRQVFAELDL